jgi:Cu/Ag efflux protein CusF
VTFEVKENTAMSKKFKETYSVKLNYQKDDGYWVIGQIMKQTMTIGN